MSDERTRENPYSAQSLSHQLNLPFPYFPTRLSPLPLWEIFPGECADMTRIATVITRQFPRLANTRDPVAQSLAHAR